jgi:type IV secretion system protein VirD4
MKKLKRRSDTYNPLDFIRADDPLGLDACRSAAEALVVREAAQEKDPHWNDRAEANIAGYMAVTVDYGSQEKDTRSLQTVADLASNLERGKMAQELMKQSPHWEGMLARAGHDMGHAQGDEAASIRSTTARHLRFLNTPAVAENTKRSSFRPRLKRGKQTIYCVISPDQMRTCSGLLRLWIDSFMKSVIREGLDESRKVHFVLDEAASLGHMASLEDAVDKYRAYGIRCQFYLQSLGQLKKMWPHDEGQTLLSNTTKVFFGTSELQTAQFISQSLGAQTIIVESGGSNTGWSKNRSSSSGGSYSESTGSSYSGGSSSNWQQQKRELLQPDEVMNLSPRTAITLMPGVRPIWTTLIRYYEEKQLFKRRGWLARITAACATFIASAVLLGIAIAAAAAVTREFRNANEIQERPVTPAAYQPLR